MSGEEAAEDQPSTVSLSLSRDELVWLNNALNEVCHGVKIPDGEFEARLGGHRRELKALLDRINGMIRVEEPGTGGCAECRRSSDA